MPINIKPDIIKVRETVKRGRPEGLGLGLGLKQKTAHKNKAQCHNDVGL